jgi:cystathionine gamma-lyase
MNSANPVNCNPQDGLRDATRVVRAGLPTASQGDPFLPGPVFAAMYQFSGDPASSPFTYGRFHNPTWTYYEQAMAELEGGPAIAFASGMAAIAAVFGTALGPGDVLVMPSDGYYTGRLLAKHHFPGIEIREIPTAGDNRSQLRGAKLLFLETPSNPGLDVCDIEALAHVAHKEGALVAVDNTTATALGQRPLALGADFSLAADTKALSGHADLLLGHVACREAEAAERMRTWRTRMGSVPGPMEVWLAHRSLASLDVRLERMCANALAIARLLAERRDVVQSVRYPGLPTDPAHAVAKRQMSRFGPVVSFELASRAHAERFFKQSRLIAEATSFGSVRTTAERRARWVADPVSAGFIRLSAGCEDAHDLLADLCQTLDSVSLI